MISSRPVGRLPLFLCAAWLGSLLCLAGCKRTAGPRRVHVRVAEVAAQDLTPKTLWGEADPGGITEDELRAACVAGLQQAGIEVDLSGASKQPGDFRLRLDLRLEEVGPSADTEQRGLMRAMARGKLTALAQPSDSGAGRTESEYPEIARLDQEALAEKIFTGAHPDNKTWIAHAHRAATDTAQTLGAQLHLLEADPGTVRALLAAKGDADLRGVAIQLLGLRKDREAVPALIELLRDPDAEVRDKAIGALIEIGDRRAVKPLAASAAFHDTFELGKILEAVASLGGDEARSYLTFVAGGHQSDTIREEAKVALSHLEQHEKQQQRAEDKGK